MFLPLRIAYSDFLEATVDTVVIGKLLCPKKHP
jgi:hypothetical protein